jgi:quercetin dioxygenase-like cupin family protein
MSHLTFVRGAQADVEELDVGIARQILGYGETIMTCRVSFQTGAAGTVHSHPHSQTAYVESGRFRFEVDGVIQELGQGDCVYVAPGQLHGSVCIEAGVLIDSFSPVRADFLGEAEQP